MKYKYFCSVFLAKELLLLPLSLLLAARCDDGDALICWNSFSCCPTVWSASQSLAVGVGLTQRPRPSLNPCFYFSLSLSLTRNENYPSGRDKQAPATPTQPAGGLKPGNLARSSAPPLAHGELIYAAEAFGNSFSRRQQDGAKNIETVIN